MLPVVEGTARQVHLSTHIPAFAYSERRSEFANRVAACVDSVFDSLFGSAARETVLLHLAVTREISKWDIVDKPIQFIEGLHGVFGDAARPLEPAILEELRKEFGLETPALGESFVDALNRANHAQPRQTSLR